MQPAIDTPTAARDLLLLRVFAGVGVLTLGLVFALVGRHLRAEAQQTVEPALTDLIDWDQLERYQIEDSEGGMRAEVDGRVVEFPVLRTDIEVDILGDVANVTVVQTFSNPAPTPVHATYVFPLHESAAVHAMTMEVGNQRIRATIDRIEEATETFEEAQRNGQAAALVTQERPNVFTQRVANLVPGVPIRVELSYVQTVPRLDGRYDLDVPLVSGPRFTPAGTGTPLPGDEVTYHADGRAIVSSTTRFGPWELDAPTAINPVVGLTAMADLSDRVGIVVRLSGGTPIRDARSTTHPMRQDWDGRRRAEFTLADGRVPDDRDFRFTYDLGDQDVSAAVLSHRDERGGYFTLRVDPPEAPSEDQVAAREMVFVLDTSGSMSGAPIETSKAFTIAALRALRPGDTFRVIQFGDAATEYSSTPLAASPANIEDAVAYVRGMDGGGGTMMTAGIHQALDPAIPDGAIRMVVFLTDGYIGNDHTVLDAVDRSIGDARLFALGVGSAVNRMLLQEMGRRGRGFARFVELDDDTEAVAAELSERLRSPVLTDVWIDWGELEVRDVYPSAIPDLFAGGSLRVSGRYDTPAAGTVTVHGRVGGHHRSFPVEVALTSESASTTRPVALLWARAAIDDAMAAFTMGRFDDGASERDALKERVVTLGLEHSLVTRWTAFVAVSEQIVNTTPDAAVEAGVPVPMVHGVTGAAYGSFGGSSTPEPATWLALLTAGAAAAAGSRRRKSAPPA